MKPTRNVRTALLTAGSLFLAAQAHAAVVVWSTPASTTDENNIITTAVGAFNYGSSTSVTVSANGEDLVFTGVTINTGTVTASGTTFTTTGFGNGQNQTNGSLFSSVGTTVGTAFESVLDSSQYNGSSVTYGGFTIGKIYQIQFFVSDERVGKDTNTVAFSSGGVTSASSTKGASPYFIATFTADAATQSFTQTVSTGGAILNAAVIGIVPEPSVALLGGLGMLALLRRRR